MGWHSTWDKPEWNNEDVKYLLADLCNAVNERRKVFNLEIDWPTISGTSQTPTNSNFIGVQVTGTPNSWSKICEHLSSAVSSLFIRPWWNSDFTAQYTKADILAAVGYTASDVAHTNWRSPRFYKGLKAILPYARYIKPTTYTHITTETLAYSISTVPNEDGLIVIPYTGQELAVTSQNPSVEGCSEIYTGSPNTESDAWDNITLFSATTSTGLSSLGYSLWRTPSISVGTCGGTDPTSVGYEVIYWPPWFLASQMPGPLNYSLTPAQNVSGGTLLKCKGNLGIDVGGTVLTSSAEVSGTLAGVAFAHYPPSVGESSEIVTVEFNSLTPTLLLNIPDGPPASFSSLGEFESPRANFSVRLLSAETYYDMLPAFSYT